MIPTDAVVDLSRTQFGVTAIFHFLFVPLTLGLSWLLVVMESAYVISGKEIYKDMTRFWAKLFAINFAMGVVTGITLEFEFGQNWAYYARFIGDAFGTALAIEGITAFMLEATMFGLFFFSWDKLCKKMHLLVTILLAIGTNLSIVNILVANSWMQDPQATTFNLNTMHLHLTSFIQVYMSELAQIRIGHVALAGFLTGSMFMLGISCYYLLKKRDVDFAKRSFAAAAGFGLIAMIGVGYMGDANGVAIAKYEPAKMAATEGQWTTQKAPASWYMIAIPDQKKEKNYFVLKIPYFLSIIATHSLSGTVEGLDDIMITNKQRIISGEKGLLALKKIRNGDTSTSTRHTFDEHKKDIGFGLLLERYTDGIKPATTTQIERATKDTIPYVFTIFWAFRVMLGCWGLMVLIMLFAFYLSVTNKMDKHRWFLRVALYSIPLPWIAAEFGWVLAEVGRQPWTVHGVLPTFLSVSSISESTVAFSLAGFIIFYSLLFVIELFLMFKYARLGPSSLGEGRYYFENRN